MSLLFADIFEAIRYLRLCKGTTEKGILDYVENRVGGCLSSGHTLKTIRALQKLVDEGVLIKRGNRYSFPTKPVLPENREQDGKNKHCEKHDSSEGEEDDNEYDSEEEEESEDDDESVCTARHKQEDDDDDDDEEDEEEDEEEEDDDDDDDCDHVRDKGENETLPVDPICPSKDIPKTISSNQIPVTGGGGGGGGGGKNSNIILSSKTDDSNRGGGIPSSKPSNRKSAGGKNEKKKNSGKSEGDQKVFEGKGKEVTKAATNVEKVRKRNISKPPVSHPAVTRKSRSKKSPKHGRHRSKSSVKKAGHSLKLDTSMEFGSPATGNQPLPDVTESIMEVDCEKDSQGNVVRRSPKATPPPNTPGADSDKKDSCCSDVDKGAGEEVKKQPPQEGEKVYSMARNVENKEKENPCRRYFIDSSKENKKMKLKREMSAERGKTSTTDNVHSSSWCSNCQKKKKKIS